MTSSLGLRVAGMKFSNVNVPETRPVAAVKGNVTDGAGYDVPFATAVLHSVRVNAPVPLQPLIVKMSRMV